MNEREIRININLEKSYAISEMKCKRGAICNMKKDAYEWIMDSVC